MLLVGLADRYLEILDDFSTFLDVLLNILFRPELDIDGRIPMSPLSELLILVNDFAFEQPIELSCFSAFDFYFLFDFLDLGLSIDHIGLCIDHILFESLYLFIYHSPLFNVRCYEESLIIFLY